MNCGFDSPESQSRLNALIAAAPGSFLSAATHHGLVSIDEAIRIAFRALEVGAISVSRWDSIGGHRIASRLAFAVHIHIKDCFRSRGTDSF